MSYVNIIAPYWDGYPEEGRKAPDDDGDANVVMMCTHIQTGVILQAMQYVRTSWIICLLSNTVFGEWMC